MATSKPVGAFIDAPPIAAAPFGLINSRTLQKDAERWEGGISFESVTCAAKVELWGVCDPATAVITDGTGKNRGVYAPPVGITAVDTCTSMGGRDRREEASERALALLEASTQKALESELMWGHIASTSDPLGRWLTSPDTVVITSSGVAVETAVAMLEDAYASCGYGGPGVIHLTRGSAAILRPRLHEDDEDEDVLVNTVGTQVIAGTGYVSDSSAPAAWQGTWAFITGPTFVWLDDPTVFPEDPMQAVDIATNDIRYKAERLGAVTFDGCCAFAAKVDLSH